MMARLHPGIVLLEQHLRPQNLSQNQVARAIKVAPRRINEIVLGKRAITADTALRLARYFGNSPSYWMHLQAEYDLERAHEKIGIGLGIIQALYMNTDRLNNIEPTTSNTLPTEKNIKRRMMR